ncbi:MAG: hypothetical protein ACLU3I_11310 [Acutalibacteraceae bacterium]
MKRRRRSRAEKTADAVRAWPGADDAAADAGDDGPAYGRRKRHGFLLDHGRVGRNERADRPRLESLARRKYDAKEETAEESERQSAYRSYLQKNEALLQQRQAICRERLLRQYPSTPELVQKLTGGQAAEVLWNRNARAEDFTTVRLGLGRMDISSMIRTPAVRFSIRSDELEEQPAKLKADYQTILQIPSLLCIGQHKLTGIIGEQARVQEVGPQYRPAAGHAAQLHGRAPDRPVPGGRAGAVQLAPLAAARVLAGQIAPAAGLLRGRLSGCFVLSARRTARKGLPRRAPERRGAASGLCRALHRPENSLQPRRLPLSDRRRQL